ncbi:paraquat-inducible protein B [Vibrio sp. JCM 19236]|nr:paraquat-inducible protein B [Vibrio sp. JCM 19236]
MPPLQHLLTGSISFYSAGSTEIHNEYPLYSSKELAQLAQFDGANKQVLTLLSPDLPPVSSGTPLYYRNLPVGQVLDYQLGHSGMEVKVLIEKQFSHLINKDTVFWNHSGVEIDAGLSGVKVNAEPLSRVLSGGIAFDTIPGVENKTGRFYKLYDNQDAARQFGEMITLVANDSNGLKKGAAINFKGVKVGEITLVSPQFAQSKVEFKARIYPEYAKTIAREGAQFWLVTPEIGLTGIKNLSSAIAPAIEVMPPGKGKPKTQFELASSKPLSSGYEFVLQAETKGQSLSTPLSYIARLR